ncbi:TPA: hypothetical protein ACX6PS_000617 [Photobacterium damselae]
MNCDWNYLNICFVKASSTTDTIFGFSEFISGLALLVIVYTTTDFRYKFRVLTAPIDLHKITFISIPTIGIGTLITELWVEQSWPTVAWNISQALWQSIFAVSFIILISAWIWYAFMVPPIFSSKNYKKFSQVLYQSLLRGNKSELNIISHEISRSIDNIVKIANSPKFQYNSLPHDHEIYFANDIILLLANKKICNSISTDAPSTAIAYFSSLSGLKNIYNNNFSLFAHNLSIAFLNNKNSQLYFENDKFASDLLGHIKPLSNSLYGDYSLIEKLSNNFSLLDIDYQDFQEWDTVQLEKYCNSVVMCFKSFLCKKNIGTYSNIFFTAIDLIKHSCFCITNIKNNTSSIYQSEELNKFIVIIDFAKNMTNALSEYNSLESDIKLRVREYREECVCDYIADLYYEIIHSSAFISEPIDTCWFIQHNITWSMLLNGFSEQTNAHKIIAKKVRRKLYNSICELNKYPNYKAARCLGYCINVLWIKSHLKSEDDNGYALRKVMLNWLKKII